MKFLVIVSVIILVFVLSVLIGYRSTEKDISRDVEKLFSEEYGDEQIYSVEQIENLPDPVQKYFKNVLKDGQKHINYVRLKHGGTFRMSAEQPWLNIKGEEYFSAKQPGFIWMGKVPFITAVDKFLDNSGNLKVKILSLFKVADVSGDKVNQGEFLRWLGEAPLFPTALLPSSNLSWEPINETSARALYRKGDIDINVVFSFNEKGEAVQFEAKRYMNDTLEDWTGYYREYVVVDDMKIPSELEVMWNLEEGDFSYARFEVEKIEFDIAERY